MVGGSVSLIAGVLARTPKPFVLHLCLSTALVGMARLAASASGWGGYFAESTHQMQATAAIATTRPKTNIIGETS